MNYDFKWVNGYSKLKTAKKTQHAEKRDTTDTVDIHKQRMVKADVAISGSGFSTSI